MNIINIILLIIGISLLSLPIIWFIFILFSFKSAIRREKLRLVFENKYSSINIFINAFLGPIYITGLYHV